MQKYPSERVRSNTRDNKKISQSMLIGFRLFYEHFCRNYFMSGETFRVTCVWIITSRTVFFVFRRDWRVRVTVELGKIAGE